MLGAVGRQSCVRGAGAVDGEDRRVLSRLNRLVQMSRRYLGTVLSTVTCVITYRYLSSTKILLCTMIILQW